MAKRRRYRRIQRDIMMNYRPKRNHAGAAFAALAVSFVLLAVLVNTAIGRYQHQLDSEGWIRAKEFYFTSDFLNGSTYTLAHDSTQVSFSVGNHADELRFSEVPIDYTVMVEPSATVTNGSGSLTANVKSDGTVTISGLQPGTTYTVTATGKESGATGTGVGYTKTLSATIKVLKQDDQVYYYPANQDGYTLLTVWNEGNAAKNVTITYTGIPDNTNPNMTDWQTNGGSKSVEIKAHQSKVFRFFNVTGTIDVTGATKKSPN